MYLSKIEREIVEDMWELPTDELDNFIFAYLGNAASRFSRDMKHHDKVVYIRHHIHLVSEKDLEEYLRERYETGD